MMRIKPSAQRPDAFKAVMILKQLLASPLIARLPLQGTLNCLSPYNLPIPDPIGIKCRLGRTSKCNCNTVILFLGKYAEPIEIRTTEAFTSFKISGS